MTWHCSYSEDSLHPCSISAYPPNQPLFFFFSLEYFTCTDFFSSYGKRWWWWCGNWEWESVKDETPLPHTFFIVSPQRTGAQLRVVYKKETDGEILPFSLSSPAPAWRVRSDLRLNSGRDLLWSQGQGSSPFSSIFWKCKPNSAWLGNQWGQGEGVWGFGGKGEWWGGLPDYNVAGRSRKPKLQ